MLFQLYRLLSYTIALPLIKILLVWRLKKGKEIAARLPERFGIASFFIKRLPDQPLIWIHAASVGESLSVSALIQQLLAQNPTLLILVTTGTVTSATLLEKRLPARAFHQFVPLDRGPWVKRFLKTWRPSLALWVESELWPNLIWETTRRNIPLIMINGRLSERSFKKWKKVKSFITPLLQRFSLCLVQTAGDKSRLSALGAKKVLEIPTLKFATDPLPYDPQELKILKTLIADRPIWLAASTHDPEEEIIIDAHLHLKQKFPHLLTLLIPRHPQRGDKLKAFFEKTVSVAQRSKKEVIAPETDIYLIDTLGELGLFYRLCSLVFMGGSLIPIGGHNLIEPAHFGTVLLHGPYMTNSQEIAALFHQEKAALEVHSAQDIVYHISRLLQAPLECRERSQAALKIVQSQDQIIHKVINELDPFLHFSSL